MKTPPKEIYLLQKGSQLLGTWSGTPQIEISGGWYSAEYKYIRADLIKQQEQPEVDLEKFISDLFDKKDTENNGRWSEDDIVEAMTNAYELGLNARQEE